eukprot:8096983-Pyramimonas_sp.AAC.1
MLSKSDFVTELGESTALRLLAAAVYTKCGAGKVLIRQGDQGIIRGLSGSIRVIKGHQLGPQSGVTLVLHGDLAVFRKMPVRP